MYRVPLPCLNGAGERDAEHEARRHVNKLLQEVRLWQKRPGAWQAAAGRSCCAPVFSVFLPMHSSCGRNRGSVPSLTPDGHGQRDIGLGDRRGTVAHSDSLSECWLEGTSFSPLLSALLTQEGELGSQNWPGDLGYGSVAGASENAVAGGSSWTGLVWARQQGAPEDQVVS